MATITGAQLSPFKHLYYREETILGPMHYQPRLKPSVWGGIETVLDIVQSQDYAGHCFRLAADHTFDYVTANSSGDLKLVFAGSYALSGDRVEFTSLDGHKVMGVLRADGRELLVGAETYSLLE